MPPTNLHNQASKVTIYLPQTNPHAMGYAEGSKYIELGKVELPFAKDKCQHCGQKEIQNGEQVR